jgi:hypothetical protein
MLLPSQVSVKARKLHMIVLEVMAPPPREGACAIGLPASFRRRGILGPNETPIRPDVPNVWEKPGSAGRQCQIRAQSSQLHGH